MIMLSSSGYTGQLQRNGIATLPFGNCYTGEIKGKGAPKVFGFGWSGGSI